MAVTIVKAQKGKPTVKMLKQVRRGIRLVIYFSQSFEPGQYTASFKGDKIFSIKLIKKNFSYKK